MTTQEARAARDAGIQQAADHAEEVHQDWGELALDAVRQFADGVRGTNAWFTSEDVRSSEAGQAVPTPPHLRAWGAVFQRAARERLIEKVGVTQSVAAHCHLAYVAKWRAV